MFLSDFLFLQEKRECNVRDILPGSEQSLGQVSSLTNLAPINKASGKSKKCCNVYIVAIAFHVWLCEQNRDKKWVYMYTSFDRLSLISPAANCHKFNQYILHTLLRELQLLG